MGCGGSKKKDSEKDKEEKGSKGKRSKIDKVSVKVIHPEEDFITTETGRTEIKLRTTEGTVLLVQLVDAESGRDVNNHTKISYKEQSADIEIRTPKRGTYSCEIFGKNKNEEDVFVQIATFTIESSAGNVQFPVTLPALEEMGCTLIEPHDGEVFTDTGELMVVLDTVKDMEMYARVIPEGATQEVKNCTKCVQDLDRMNIFVHAPKAGKFMLQIFAKYKESNDVAKKLPMRQILGFEVTAKASLDPFPAVYPKFEELDLKLLTPQSGLIRTQDGKAIVELSCPGEEVTLSSTLKNLDKDIIIEQCTYIVKGGPEKEKNIIYVHTPEPGSYLLTIYARRAKVKTKSPIISFKLKSTGFGALKFPKRQAAMEEMNITLIEPLDGLIRTETGETKVIICTNGELKVFANLKDELDREIANCTKCYEKGENMEIQIQTPKEGKYELEIFAMYKDAPKLQMFKAILGFSLVSEGSADSFPNTYPNFDIMNFKIIGPQCGLIKSEDGKVKIELEYPGGRKGLKIGADLRHYEQAFALEQCTYVRSIENMITIESHTPEAGRYVLYIYEEVEGKSKGVGIIEYIIESEGKGKRFPIRMGGLEEMKMKLIEPAEGEIETSTGEAKIVVSTNGDLDIEGRLKDDELKQIIPNTTKTTVTTTDGEIEIIIHTPHKGKFQMGVYAKYKNAAKTETYKKYLGFSITSESSAPPFPCTYPKFHKFKFLVISPEEGLIKTEVEGGGKVVLLYPKELDLKISALLKQLEGGDAQANMEECVDVQMVGENTQVNFRTPQLGKYLLKILAAKSGNETPSEIVDFNIESIVAQISPVNIDGTDPINFGPETTMELNPQPTSDDVPDSGLNVIAPITIIDAPDASSSHTPVNSNPEPDFGVVPTDIIVASDAISPTHPVNSDPKPDSENQEIDIPVLDPQVGSSPGNADPEPNSGVVPININAASDANSPPAPENTELEPNPEVVPSNIIIAPDTSSLRSHDEEIEPNKTSRLIKPQQEELTKGIDYDFEVYSVEAKFITLIIGAEGGEIDSEQKIELIKKEESATWEVKTSIREELEGGYARLEMLIGEEEKAIVLSAFKIV